MSLRRRIGAVAVAVALATGVGGMPAFAQEANEETAAEGTDATADEADGTAEAEDGGAAEGADLEAYWARRLARAAQRIALAREKAGEAEAAYSRARHDANPRGEELEQIKERHFSAERELRDAEEALPRLVEQARRAGVPPGILREYWDEDEEA